MAESNLIGKSFLGYTVTGLLGTGAFGAVYKAVKKNPSGEYVRALKHIVIPSEKQYESIFNSMGGDLYKVDDYFSQLLENIVTEIQILNNFSEKGVSNIVRYYENDIISTESPKRYNIFILMEYLTPLSNYITKTEFTVKDVVRFGKDVLAAIASCHDNGIIHRDIKDDNIFVSENGEFKIGDFGVSKVLKDTSKADSIKGTPNFLAPEVYLGKEGYTKSVDLYSLGIVLYRLLNYNRNPFLPCFPEAYDFKDEEKAFDERMKGSVPKLPSLGGELIGNIIIKAISGKTDRYSSAKEFYDELESALKNTPQNILETKIRAASSANYRTMSEEKKETSQIANETIKEDTSVGKLSSTIESKAAPISNLFDAVGEKYDPDVSETSNSQLEKGKIPTKTILTIVAALLLVAAIPILHFALPGGLTGLFAGSELPASSETVMQNPGDDLYSVTVTWDDEATVTPLPAAEIHRGDAGNNIIWMLDTSTGMLTLSGAGSMWDWGRENLAPWDAHMLSITKVVISEGITTIGNNAFAEATGLTSVDMPNITTIGDSAFREASSLTSIDMPSVTIIGDFAFWGASSLASVDMPNVTTIGDSAFREASSLASIDIPASVTYIGGGAFIEATSLTEIRVAPGNVRYSDIGGVLFNDTATRLHTYPAGRDAAHYATPNSVTTIGWGAFSGANRLLSVDMPNVTYIRTQAFSGVRNLASATIRLRDVTFGNNVFEETHPNFTIHGFRGSTAHTYARDNGHNFVSLIIPVTSITGVPSTTVAEAALTLTGTVNPSTATNRIITWSVVSAGGTGATISGSRLNTTSAGTATIRATIANGRDDGDFTQDFRITVTSPVTFSVFASANNSAFGRGAVWIGTGGEREQDWINTRNFTQGSTVHLRAFARHGYSFVRWEVVTGNVALSDATSSNASFTMPVADVSVRAVFELHRFFIVNAGVLNVRAAPNIDSEVIGRLRRGDIVEVTRIVEETDDIRGAWGWVVGHGWSNLYYLVHWYYEPYPHTHAPNELLNPYGFPVWTPVEHRITRMGTSTIRATDFDATPYGKEGADGAQQVREGHAVRTEGNESEWGSNIGWIGAGDWVQFTSVFVADGIYNFVVAIASGVATPGGVRVMVGDIEVGTSAPAPSNGWQAYERRTVGEAAIPTGEHVIRVEFPAGGLNFAALEINRIGDMPAIPPETPPLPFRRR